MTHSRLLIPEGFNFDLTYYVSGPMSGYENYNYTFFEEVYDLFSEHGIKIESPHHNPWPENHKELNDGELWLEMMKLAFKQVDNSHGMILLRGWQYSNGAKREVMRMTGIRNEAPFYYFDDERVVLVDMNRKYVSANSEIGDQDE